MKKRRREAKRTALEQGADDPQKEHKKAKDDNSMDERAELIPQTQSFGPKPAGPLSVGYSSKPTNTSESSVTDPTDDTTEAEKKLERQRLKNRQRKEQRKNKKATKAKVEQELRDAQAKLQQDKLANQKAKELLRKEAEQAEQENFQTLSMGVQARDVSMGTGAAVKNRAKVCVRYTLRAEHKRGKVIDTRTGFEFRVGKGDVIKGWDIGLIGMRQGGVRHLIVPPSAGYGKRNVGAGPGGVLFFEVTLVSC